MHRPECSHRGDYEIDGFRGNSDMYRSRGLGRRRPFSPLGNYGMDGRKTRERMFRLGYDSVINRTRGRGRGPPFPRGGYEMGRGRDMN